MNPRHSIPALAALLLSGFWTSVNAGGDAPQATQAVTGSKPSVPLTVRWLRDGSEGVVEIEVSAGVDHDGLDVTLVLPGQGRLSGRSLPAASAGPAGTVTWELDAPVTTPPRAVVILRQGSARQAGSFVAPDLDIQDQVRPDGQPEAGQPAGKRPRAAGEAGLSAEALEAEARKAESLKDESGEAGAVHLLPAQETLERGEPGPAAEPDPER